MRFTAKKILGVVLSMVVLLISSHVLAQEQSQGDQISGAKPELPITVPDLAEIIPLATGLSHRLVVLENKVTGVLDVSAFGREYAKI